MCCFMLCLCILIPVFNFKAGPFQCLFFIFLVFMVHSCSVCMYGILWVYHLRVLQDLLHLAHHGKFK